MRSGVLLHEDPSLQGRQAEFSRHTISREIWMNDNAPAEPVQSGPDVRPARPGRRLHHRFPWEWDRCTSSMESQSPSPQAAAAAIRAMLWRPSSVTIGQRSHATLWSWPLEREKKNTENFSSYGLLQVFTTDTNFWEWDMCTFLPRPSSDPQPAAVRPSSDDPRLLPLATGHMLHCEADP